MKDTRPKKNSQLARERKSQWRWSACWGSWGPKGGVMMNFWKCKHMEIRCFQPQVWNREKSKNSPCAQPGFHFDLLLPGEKKWPCSFPQPGETPIFPIIGSSPPGVCKAETIYSYQPWVVSGLSASLVQDPSCWTINSTSVHPISPWRFVLEQPHKTKDAQAATSNWVEILPEFFGEMLPPFWWFTHLSCSASLSRSSRNNLGNTTDVSVLRS